MNNLRLGVVGAGSFGANHLRVLSELPGITLAAIADTDPGRASQAASQWNCRAFTDAGGLIGIADAAIVATPTSAHAEVGCLLLEGGLDVLIEKPIAPDLPSARALIDTAFRQERILQIGHLERFNPAVQMLRTVSTLPLFFEIHRMSVFTPRSLDIDVVLDLMIHDVDILLSLTGSMPEEIRAAGIRILSDKVDIANVRLAFGNGCIANLTASRMSVEKIRKLRLFQPGEYISIDYARQDISRISVTGETVAFDSPTVERGEPLRLELESFVESVRTRRQPVVSGEDALRALEVCLAILDKIKEHGQLVECTVSEHLATSPPLPSSSGN